MKRIIFFSFLVACCFLLAGCATGKMYKSAASKSNALSTSQVTLALAEAGDPHYQYYAGLCYESGSNGFKKDLEQAIGWYQASAAKKYLPAYSRLGALYEFGRGFPRDKNMAIIYYEAAALSNMDNYIDNEYFPFIKMEMVFAQQQLGRLYSSGDGIEPDHAKGYMWNKIVLNHEPATGDGDLDHTVGEFQELAKLFNAMLEAKMIAEEWKQGEAFYQKYLQNHTQWLAAYNGDVK